ncbi:hypothetical protein JCM3774_003811 [Rhodotorula dairenensis]
MVWASTIIAEEETIRNDYAGHYVHTGSRPQNHLRNTDVQSRFQEYPKLSALLEHKHALTASPLHSIPPTYLNVPAAPGSSPSNGFPSAMSLALQTLTPSRFDSILLTPPRGTSFEELKQLDLARVAANPGFVWLWVGSGQSPSLALTDADTDADAGTEAEAEADGIGLEKGRELLSLWGYRRCEDIVWLKTNKRDPEADLVREPTSLFTPTIEHCLMGIRGTVRRSTDSFLVHCNVDTDVIIWEGDDQDPDLKPPELQSLIENFCLGTRRLHLYGSPHALRRGWLTLSSPAPSPVRFSAESIVHPVEREGTASEQRERWGAPREWTRDEWEARWKKPGVPVSMIGSGSGGAGAASTDMSKAGSREGVEKVQRVDTLLPYVEELDALRPKSPPPRDGLPSSGGLGRGRGAGLGVTRSGLVSQPNNASLYPLPDFLANGNVLNGKGAGAGRGRGRGRGGRGRNNPGGMMRDEVLLTPGPMRHDVVPPRMPVTRPPPPPMGMSYPALYSTRPQQHGLPPPPQEQPRLGYPSPYPQQQYPLYAPLPTYQYPPSFPPHAIQGSPYPSARSYSSPPAPTATAAGGAGGAGNPYVDYSVQAPPTFPQQHQVPLMYGGSATDYLSPRLAQQHAYAMPYPVDQHLSSGINSLSLASTPAPVPGLPNGGELVYPISSRSSTTSRNPSSATSTNSGGQYEDA